MTKSIGYSWEGVKYFFPIHCQYVVKIPGASLGLKVNTAGNYQCHQYHGISSAKTGFKQALRVCAVTSFGDAPSVSAASKNIAICIICIAL